MSNYVCISPYPKTNSTSLINQFYCICFKIKQRVNKQKLRLSSLKTAATPATARAPGPRRRRATSTPRWWRRWGRHRHLSLTSSGRRRRSRYKKKR